MIFKKVIYKMRFHVLIPECIKKTEWHNTGMLINILANALKTQDYTNK